MKKLVTLIALMIMFGASSAFAADIFSDTFTGTALDTIKWPGGGSSNGAVTQNNELRYIANDCNLAFSYTVTSKTLSVDSAIDAMLVSGTWAAQSLKTGDYFYITVKDGSSNRLSIGYTIGTGFGYWNGTVIPSHFVSLGSLSSVPSSMTNFSLALTATGWVYSENGTALYTNSSSPLGTVGGDSYSLTLGLKGTAANFQAMQVDNINVSVTPEPVSCALFVIGGGALALMRRRKA